jgi:hypothetical protein
MESELIVTGAFPVEVSVRGMVTVAPVATAPKLRLVEFVAIVGTPDNTSHMPKLNRSPVGEESPRVMAVPLAETGDVVRCTQ